MRLQVDHLLVVTKIITVVAEVAMVDKDQMEEEDMEQQVLLVTLVLFKKQIQL